MPRSRGSEMPQRQSARGPHPLRTSNSDLDSNSLHRRPVNEPSSKLGGRRSPRALTTETLNQKKLGTRIADLESQLGQAQDELKTLKEQLASAEAAKKELETKTKKPPVLDAKENPPTDEGTHDVSQVPVVNESEESETQLNDLGEKGNDSVEVIQPPVIVIPPAISEQSALKDEEINMLKAKLESKENELVIKENESENLKNLLEKANSSISVGKEKEEEMMLKLSQMEQKLEEIEANAGQLIGKLEAAEGVKEALETEIRMMRVQTEQWRKAADAAAAVLAGAVEINGRMTERCGSMDKQFGGSIFETPAGFVGSPRMADDMDYGLGSGKRKGSGIRMFGDLWKKKGQK